MATAMLLAFVLYFGIVPVNGSGEIIVFPLCFSLVRTSLKEAKGHTLDCVTRTNDIKMSAG